MKGHRLYNPGGDYLGRIETVAFYDNGQPAMIFISVMDNKIVGIPFSALVPSSASDRFVANVTPEQIRNAPGYSINSVF